MKVVKFSATSLLLFFIFLKMATGQSLRGSVRETATGDGLYSATVFLFDKKDSALVVATTDLTGGFHLKTPKPGIFSLKISQIGFETRIIPEIELNFGKETILEISLKEAPGELKTVEIRPDGSDNRLPMAGLHLLTRDQVLRYPATFFDPARLAQSLPGISNDDQNNGISIRGLSPALFQYRIEGLEVVNPNHLSNAGTITDLPTANSGGVSMLSAQMLGNSAIYTGTTPVGYGNSVGGLMDIRLRPGNNEHFEGTIQAGLVGLDASVEGPISRANKSSFLVNYRYSTIGLLEKMGVQLGDEVVNFQDLSVFLKLPTKKEGYFSIFSIIGKSSNDYYGKETDQQSDKEFQDILYGQMTGIFGTKYYKRFKHGGQLNLGLAYSSANFGRTWYEILNQDNFASLNFHSDKLSLMAKYDKRIFKMVLLETGLEMTNVFVDSDVSFTGYPHGLLVDGGFSNSRASQLRNHVQLIIPIGLVTEFLFGFRYVMDDATQDGGLKRLVQPQGSFLLKLNKRDRFVCSIGRNDQILLAHGFPAELFKRGLDSWRGSAKLEKHINERNKLAVGVFYQKFLQIQISNLRNRGLSSPLDWTDFFDIELGTTFADVHLGGLEASLSRPFSNGYFYEINASLFDAKQEIRPGDFITTRFNSRWTANFLTGKDWSKTFENGTTRTLGINLRIHARGGFWETPIDTANSKLQQTTIFETGSENSLRLPNYFRSDLRLFWKKNKKNRTGTLALDVQNVTNRLNVAWHFYDPFLEKIVAKTGLGLVPILSYRLEFQGKSQK